MRTILTVLHAAVVAELLVSGGSVVLRNDRHENSGGEQFFSYDYSKHGQEWVAGSCSSRARQSPIDLPAAVPVTGTFAYKYNPIVSPIELMNNGHAYSADLAGLGYGGLTYENAWYNLLNINVHSLSEHTWAGLQQPLELHLVHKRYDGDALLVVAIAVDSPLLNAQSMAAAMAPAPAAAGSALFQLNASAGAGFLNKAEQAPQYPYPAGTQYTEPPATEPGFNPALQAFLKMPPPPVNMKVRVPADSAHAYDLNSMMSGGSFYEYAGSLTAPPCAEIVTWLVRSDPIKASDKQVMYLHDAVYKTTADFGNYRSLMPLNGRVISMRQGQMEDMPPTAAPPVQMPGKPQQSDREFRAMKWAMDAMTIAKSATDYVKDLDSRLRSAAQAHANALRHNWSH
jgi:carbonic anhydrase